MAAAKSFVGIDFGTSTSFVATPAAGIVPIGERSYLPSIAGVLDRRLLVGEAATVLPPNRIIRSAKRAITDRQIQLPVGGRYATSQRPRDQVITAILKELKARARDGGSPLKAADTLRFGCPAEWTHDQRQLLLDLAKAGGLPIKHAEIVEEPVAAGVDWLERRGARSGEFEGRLLVFDMGGGTLDVAVMHVIGGNEPQITVLTSVGARTAGDALDEAIFEDIVAHYELDLASMPAPMRASHHVLQLALETKIRLSTDASHDVFPNARLLGAAKLASLRYPREKLNDVFTPLMDEAEAVVVRALRLARLADYGGADLSTVQRLDPSELAKEVDFVLLVGGMSRVPYVRQRLEALFRDAEFILDYGTADEAVVRGLISTAKLNTINMYRPAFDFYLAWLDERVRLYTSYTPLFSAAELMRGQSKLAYRFELKPNRLPRNGNGHLEAYAADGSPVSLTHRLLSARSPDGEKTVAALPVRFGSYPVRFALYTDGRIHLTDGHGDDHELRVAGWPVMLRPGTVPQQREPADPPVYYPFNKS
jgi:molecular chaperone DnaK (HSP70)